MCAGRIDASASLRDALNLLLEGADRVAVVDGERAAGVLTFDDVRRAIAPAGA